LTLPTPNDASYDDAINRLFFEVKRIQDEVADLKRSTVIGQGAVSSHGLEAMEKVADLVLAKHPLPEGRFAAITFDGELVSESVDLVPLLKAIRERTGEIFIWKVGSGPISSW
jgi:hypothetical protein